MSEKYIPEHIGVGEIVIDEHYLSDPAGFLEKHPPRTRRMMEVCGDILVELLENGLVELDETVMYIGGVLRSGGRKYPYLAIRRGQRTIWIPIDYLCPAAWLILYGAEETINRLSPILSREELAEAEKLLEWLRDRLGV